MYNFKIFDSKDNKIIIDQAKSDIGEFVRKTTCDLMKINHHQRIVTGLMQNVKPGAGIFSLNATHDCEATMVSTRVNTGTCEALNAVSTKNIIVDYIISKIKK